MDSGAAINPALMLIPIIIGGMIGLVAVIISIIAFCRIFSKAGYCWALGLLILIPLGNLIMLLVLAFSDWPIKKELRGLKQSQNSGD